MREPTQVHIIRRVSLREEMRYFRTDRLEIAKVGRWGPRWLHRLIWRAAHNLGMIRHMIDERPIRTRIVLDRESEIIKSIQRQAMGWLNHDFYRTDLIAIMGHEQLDTALSAGQGVHEFEIGRKEPGNRPEHRIAGVRICLIPNMDGCVVIPVRYLQ